MWDMTTDRDYIKIRNKSKTVGGWRQNKGTNTVRVICAEDLLADLVQRVFSNRLFVLRRALS